MKLIYGLVAAAAALYVVSPIDLLPDFIPIVGWIDDAGAAIAGLIIAFKALKAK